MKRFLITGCEGFIGTYLANFLVNKGNEVSGSIYENTHGSKSLEGRIPLIPCDLTVKEQVDSLVKKTKPDIIFHLAAQSMVTVSWEDPEKTLKANIMGSFYLLDAISKYCPKAVTEIVGSSAVYGPRRPGEMPLKEDTDYKPTSMYAVSKIGEENLGFFYQQAFGMHVIRVRPFNMTGPGKMLDACSDFTREIVEIERGKRQEMEVGNLDTVRDFTDGRDVVNALWLLAEKGENGQLYNLCSNKGQKLSDILAMVIRLSGRDIKYKIVPERLRRTDDPIYIGDNSKLSAIGWKSEIPIEKTLADMINWWRENL